MKDSADAFTLFFFLDAYFAEKYYISFFYNITMNDVTMMFWVA